MSNDFANPRCSLCGSLLHFTDQHPDPTPPLTAERLRLIEHALPFAVEPVAMADIRSVFSTLRETWRERDDARAAHAQVLAVLRDVVEAHDAPVRQRYRTTAALERARALLAALPLAEGEGTKP